MAVIDRFRRLFRPSDNLVRYTGSVIEYRENGGVLPSGVVGPWGTLGGGWPVEADWNHWNRYNGFPGTSFTFGHGGECGDGSCGGRPKARRVEWLYRTQPHLQTVVSFRARNVAQLPLHMYRIQDDVHDRVHGPLAGLWSRPNRHQTGFELVRDLVSSLDLYGDAYWLVTPDAESEAGWTIEPVPVPWIRPDGGTLYSPARYIIKSPLQADGAEVTVPGEQIVRFAGYGPGGLRPVSPVEALFDVLQEQISAWEYRRQAWKRGGRAGTYIYRPKDAPEWSEKAHDRFLEEWHQFQNSGSRAGETPLFEDGMELRKVGFSAREDEWADVARLSLQTVCAVYHVTPAMLGADGTATYASVKEFRSMLYTETLGPIIRQIEQRINNFVLPIIAPDDAALAVKFNIDAKLAGSFEEQASVLSTATGAPWMTTNEARALRNLPAIDGGDGLVVPLNVIKGGQASPQDGGTPSVAVQNATGG